MKSRDFLYSSLNWKMPEIAPWNSAQTGLRRLPRGLADVAQRLEDHAVYIFAFLSVLYILLIRTPLWRPFWFDELFTFYISRSPSLTRFFDAIHHVDLNPPLVYALARLSQNIFGVNEAATRLPSVIAFYLASLAFFIVLKRRLGVLWTAAVLLLFWFTPFFDYATEARPYALLLAFFGLTLLSWEAAARTRQGAGPWIALAGIAVGGAGMILSHVLAPVYLLPFVAAEAVRNWRSRRIHWLVWAALLLPLLAAFDHSPQIQQSQQLYFPPIFQASPRKTFIFYAKAAGIFVSPALPVAALAAFAACFLSRRRISATSPFARWRPPDLVLVSVLLVVPVFVNAALMRSRMAFWERYCIPSGFAICAVEIAALARLTRGRRFAAPAAVCALSVALFAGPTAPTLLPTSLDIIRPDLPFVAASGLTFLEMDRYEKPSLVKRLYYLQDRPSAIKYANATLFEGMDSLRSYFPIRANVMPYQKFVRENHHFLVFGEIKYPEDWLLRKLIAEGQTVKLLQHTNTQYKDWSIYEVSLRQ